MEEMRKMQEERRASAKRIEEEIKRQEEEIKKYRTDEAQEIEVEDNIKAAEPELEKGDYENNSAEHFMLRWMNEFPDFDPADVLTFEVAHRDSYSFFDEIPIETPVRGAYTVISGEEPVDVRIIGPSRKQVFKRKGEPNGFFNFNTTEKGQFEFSFSNRRFIGSKKVLVAVQIGKSDVDFVTAKELDPIE